MKVKKVIRNEEGFTLVEIIAVLIILGILAAVAVPRYIDLEENAKERAIDAAISELNGRESLTWADVKISQTGWSSDADVLNRMTGGTEPDLGEAYTWIGTMPSAGTSSDVQLSFKNATNPADVRRIPSTDTSPGRWKKL